MAQATKTRKLKKRSEPSEGPLQTFTDSVERIGGDPAIFGLVNGFCILSPWVGGKSLGRVRTRWVGDFWMAIEQICQSKWIRA